MGCYWTRWPTVEDWQPSLRASQVALALKKLPVSAGEAGSILGPEDPLEEGMAARSFMLAWRIPWTEGPGGLQSMGSQRIGHD